MSLEENEVDAPLVFCLDEEEAVDPVICHSN